MLITTLGFAGLTAIAFVTRKDFSFLESSLRFGFTMALVLIIAAPLFGLRLGVFFNVGMVALAGGAILYDASGILRCYPKTTTSPQPWSFSPRPRCSSGTCCA